MNFKTPLVWSLRRKTGILAIIKVLPAITKVKRHSKRLCSMGWNRYYGRIIAIKAPREHNFIHRLILKKWKEFSAKVWTLKQTATAHIMIMDIKNLRALRDIF